MSGCVVCSCVCGCCIGVWGALMRVSRMPELACALCVLALCVLGRALQGLAPPPFPDSESTAVGSPSLSGPQDHLGLVGYVLWPPWKSRVRV